MPARVGLTIREFGSLLVGRDYYPRTPGCGDRSYEIVNGACYRRLMAKAKQGGDSSDADETSGQSKEPSEPSSGGESDGKKRKKASSSKGKSAGKSIGGDSRWRRARRWLLRGLVVLVIALVALASVVLFRTWRFTSRQPTVSPAAPLAMDIQPAAERLARSVQIKTISFTEGPSGAEVYGPMHALLRESYPLVHQRMTREVIAEHSLLYTWPGSDPQSRPVIFLAHLDVVPVPAENLSKWTHPPFSGAIVDGYIWGRGTLDDKVSVMGLLESAEALLARGYQPKRTIYLAFGHDEELGGDGAKQVAQTLAERGVKAEFALDEGMIITRGIMKSIDAPLATIGIAEKGNITIELTAHAQSGHSSVPPSRTAVGALSRAITALEANQMPASLDGPIRHTLAYMGPEMPFVERMAMANLWLFSGMILDTFLANKNTRAITRTTTAPTILKGGTKNNILPGSAQAIVNFRISPNDSIADVLAHVRRVMDDDRIDIEVLQGMEPTPVSSSDSNAFKLLLRTARQVFSGAVVAPSVVVGGTDGRHYEIAADDVYRFLPVIFESADIERLHGIDERISIEGYGQLIRYYTQLFNNLQDL